MAIVKSKAYTYIPEKFDNVTTTPTFSSTTVRLNSATDVVAFVLNPPQDMTIRKIKFRTGTVTTGCTVDVRIETFDTSTGFPTGTLWATNTNVTQAIADTDDNAWFSVTLTADATVNQGDFVCIVWRVSSGTPSNLQISGFTDSGMPYSPYILEYDGSWSFIDDTAPVIVIEDSSGNVNNWLKAVPFNATQNSTIASGNVMGMRFKLKHKSSVSGVYIWIDSDANGKIELYDNDGTTILKSSNTYVNVPPIATAGIHHVMFDEDVVLEADTFYYVGWRGASGSASTIYGCSSATSTDMNGYSGEDEWAQALATTPTQPSDWTISQDYRVFIGLIINGIDVSTGGGGETSHTFVG